MDTESIVQQMVAAKQIKVDNLKNDQKKLEWKQTAWQELNSKIYSFYSNTLSKLRLSGAYQKKTTTSSDTTKANVLANANAVNGTQTLEIKKLAKTGYLTGAKLSKMELGTEEVKGTLDTKLEDLGIKAGSKIGVSVNAQPAAYEITIDAGETVQSFMDKVNANGLGVSLSFDGDAGVFTVEGPLDGSKFKLTQGPNDSTIVDALGLGEVFKYDNSTTGKKTGGLFQKPAYIKTDAHFKASGDDENDLYDIAPDILKGHSITVKTGTGDNAKETKITFDDGMKISDFVKKLKEAGVNASFDEENQRFFISSKATGADNDFSITDDTADGSVLTALGFIGGDSNKVAAQDAEIVLNGATYTSTTNAFNVNGLTINATGVTDGEITITTATDYQGAYDTIKDFLSEYNELINEMDKLYNADSARKYSMLSEEEKESMSDEEVEKWEGTIKGALLRKDSQLSTVMNTMVNAMLKSFDINGERKGLSSYGIKTLSYFNAKDFEHHAYHIDGDPDDENVSAEEDELMKALTEDPEGTTQFFADLCKNLYDSLDEIMSKTSEYSSIYKVYNDKQLKKDYDNYTKQIKEAEEKLSDYEDKWYDKFSKMETALSKLQSNQSIVSSMLGN